MADCRANEALGNDIGIMMVSLLRRKSRAPCQASRASYYQMLREVSELRQEDKETGYSCKVVEKLAYEASNKAIRAQVRTGPTAN